MMKIKFDRDDKKTCDGSISCKNCNHSYRAELTQCYYTHEVLICGHNETEGMIVDDYGYQKVNLDKYARIHKHCPLKCNKLEAEWCDASNMKSSYAQIHKDGDDSFHYILCPYCYTMNKLPDSKIGYKYCGCCDKLFKVR